MMVSVRALSRPGPQLSPLLRRDPGCRNRRAGRRGPRTRSPWSSGIAATLSILDQAMTPRRPAPRGRRRRPADPAGDAGPPRAVAAAACSGRAGGRRPSGSGPVTGSAASGRLLTFDRTCAATAIGHARNPAGGGCPGHVRPAAPFGRVCTHLRNRTSTFVPNPVDLRSWEWTACRGARRRPPRPRCRGS